MPSILITGANRGLGFEFARHQFRGHQSGLGQNRYGRSKCAIDSNGERKCDETSDRDPRTGPNRQVFQSRWSRISLVRSNSQQCWRGWWHERTHDYALDIAKCLLMRQVERIAGLSGTRY